MLDNDETQTLDAEDMDAYAAQAAKVLSEEPPPVEMVGLFTIQTFLTSCKPHPRFLADSSWKLHIS